MKTILPFLLLLTLGCYESRPKTFINCEYKGGVILNKQQLIGETMYDILYKGKAIEGIFVYPIDSAYKIGDVIYKPCLK
jgi:hypothetical protein